MAVQKIIIDCDPGIDDALALVFAHGNPDLELLGITTVAGNVDLGQTTANALRVRDFAGMPEVPVTAGCPGPLVRPGRDARDVHGSSGLGAARIPVASSGPADPPMITNLPTWETRSGYRRSASATLVSGPIAISVICPGSALIAAAR